MNTAVIEAPTAEEVAQQEVDQQAAFDSVTAEPGPRNAPVKKAPEPEPKVEEAPKTEAVDTTVSQPPGPLIAGMTDEELKTTLAQVKALDGKLGSEVQRVFSKIGEVQRVVQDMEKQLKAGGGNKTVRQMTGAMLKRVNEELPGFGDALAADLNEILGAEGAADLQEAKADAAAKGEVFDPEKYYAEKLGPALQAMEKRTGDEQRRLVAEARQYARIDSKHENWETTINTPEFNAFAYANGPTDQERARDRELSRTDPAGDDARKAAMAQKYPKWWAETGHMISSDKAADAIKLLDNFEASKTKVTQQSGRSKARLEAAIPVKGAPSGEQRQTQSDADAMQAAFDAVADAT